MSIKRCHSLWELFYRGENQLWNRSLWCNSPIIQFNPIFPVYLQDKELWTTIDILSAIAFVWAGIYVNKKLKEDGNEHKNDEL